MIHALITLIIYLLILGLVVWLVNYVVDAIPLPEPLGRLAKVAVIVVAVLVVILLLLQVVGQADIGLPKIGGLNEVPTHYNVFIGFNTASILTASSAPALLYL